MGVALVAAQVVGVAGERHRLIGQLCVLAPSSNAVQAATPTTPRVFAGELVDDARVTANVLSPTLFALFILSVVRAFSLTNNLRCGKNPY